MLWDIFCRVIDNFGDIGVCWRLSADLAGRGHAVRLWVDDPSPLSWMAPAALQGGLSPVEVRPWGAAEQVDSTLPPADVWVEAFGCDIPQSFVGHRFATGSPPHPLLAWINLEYLSAEPYAERCHRLPSPIQQGAAQGFSKYFFYPGFTSATGGLLREPGLLERRLAFDDASKAAWLCGHGIRWRGEPLISLFCYEPTAIHRLLQDCTGDDTQRTLLVTPGRATASVLAALRVSTPASAAVQHGPLQIVFLPHLTQSDFDLLLWTCDLNLVRGEDSWVRALWAGRPFIWQAYPQSDGAHVDKLDAFLDWMQPSDSLRLAHALWNGVPDAEKDSARSLIPWSELPQWQNRVLEVRSQLSEQTDLTSQLLQFVGQAAMKNR